MIGKKINQLATELAPVSTDLTIIGDPTTGVSKKITLAQLGAIFSGAVSFYTNLAGFPATGDINVIYCAKDTQKLYLWSGSAYVEVFPSQALLDTYQLRSEKGNANGYASLDSQGKVPISQLPSSIMEYKGTWNASTNTPTLANGTGDTGDVYICNVAGTVNFGAGPITFAVGDYVIYSGTIWQRSSGAVGTVTSVALTVGGDAISVSGSPLTTSGTLALAFSGTTSQYIRGNGTLANFPTSLVTGTGTINRVTKWSFTSGEIINSGIVDIGGSIYNTLTTPGQFAWQFNGDTSTGLSYGALIVAGTNSSDIALRIENASSTSVYFYVWGDGRVQINNIPNATTDTDRFLVSDNGVIKYRTGAELLSDIGGASATGYVPYTGATANLDLGTHTLLAAKGTFSSSGSGDTVGITHSSGSGIALNITKGGNGEGLYINKTSGSGNAATIIGTLNATTLVKSGGTSSQFLKADGSVDSTAYGTGSVTSVGLSSATSGVTIGSTPITTSGTITLAIATASGSQQGLLSSTDWTTFNNKQNALTNPVTGTGTTNYIPKFTGTSTIGNSQIFDNGTQLAINTGSPSGFGTQRFLVVGSAASQVARFTDGANGDLVFDFPSATISRITAQYGTGGVLVFANGTGFNEQMRLNASGNLSIGNTNDTFKLDVTGTGRFVSSGSASVIVQRGNTSSGATIDFNTSTTNNWFMGLRGLANNDFYIYNQTAGANNLILSASTGAATFSSSVTAAKLIVDGASNGNISQIALTRTDSSWGVFNETDLRFYQSNSNTSTPSSVKMVITTAGNVGIGTTSPGYKLQVNGGNEVGSRFIVTGTYAPIQFSGDNSTTLGGVNAYSGIVAIGRGTSTGVNPDIAINSSGNVGIGTTSPSTTLDISVAEASLRLTSTTGTNFTNQRIVNTGGTLWSGIERSTGGVLGITGAYEAFLLYGADNPMYIGTGNSFLRFGTNSTERMRITSGGNVEINTGSIKTGEPDTGWGRAAIKIGASVSGTAFNVTRYLPVSVDGTVYYINLNSSTP